MSGQPSVSIVLVTFNRAAVLPATLRSIFGQTSCDWELLICDDASTDGTQRVVSEWAGDDQRCTYLGATTNMGMPHNLNRGLDAARAELIAVMHDGDIYESTCIERWQTAIQMHPTAGFVFNRYVHIRADGTLAAPSVDQYPPLMSGCDLLEEVFYRRWRFGSPVHGTAMFRREALDSVGYPDSAYRQFADVDFWMRLCEHYDVAFVDEPLIRLATRERLPQSWRTSDRTGRRLVRRAFANSRRRHYSEHPTRLGVELGRHALFTVMHEAYHSIIELRNLIADGKR